MSEPIAEVTETEDVREFIEDELGHAIDDEFLREAVAVDEDDFPVQDDTEPAPPVVEEVAEEVAPPAPPLQPISAATQAWQNRQAKREENARITELEAEVASLRQPVAPPVAQQPVAPQEQQAAPEPDKAEDEGAWFQWKLEEVEREKNIMRDYLIRRAQGEQVQAQQQQHRQQQYQQAVGFLGNLKSHESEWNEQRPGYFDRSEKVMNFIKATEAKNGGTNEQVEQRVQNEIYGMLYRAQSEGKPPAVIIENIYSSMVEMMGGDGHQQAAVSPQQQGAFTRAQNAQQDGSTGSVGATGGGGSVTPINAEDMASGHYTSGDANRALDKMGTEGYLDIIQKALR